MGERPCVEEAGGKAAEEAHHLVRRLLVSSWELGPPRRVIAKVEWHQGALFPGVGFIVTNMSAGLRPKRPACSASPARPAAKWVHLSRDGGPDAFHDRSSRPGVAPATPISSGKQPFPAPASRAAIAESNQPPEKGLAVGRVHRLDVID